MYGEIPLYRELPNLNAHQQPREAKEVSIRSKVQPYTQLALLRCPKSRVSLICRWREQWNGLWNGPWNFCIQQTALFSS